MITPSFGPPALLEPYTFSPPTAHLTPSPHPHPHPNSELTPSLSLIQKYTSGLTASTERHLAQKAGHLEILAGGKGRKKGESGGVGGGKSAGGAK